MSSLVFKENNLSRWLRVKTSYLYFVECSRETKSGWIILLILMYLISKKYVFNKSLNFRFV